MTIKIAVTIKKSRNVSAGKIKSNKQNYIHTFLGSVRRISTPSAVCSVVDCDNDDGEDDDDDDDDDDDEKDDEIGSTMSDAMS